MRSCAACWSTMTTPSSVCETMNASCTCARAAPSGAARSAADGGADARASADGANSAKAACAGSAKRLAPAHGAAGEARHPRVKPGDQSAGGARDSPARASRPAYRARRWRWRDVPPP